MAERVIASMPSQALPSYPGPITLHPEAKRTFLKAGRSRIRRRNGILLRKERTVGKKAEKRRQNPYTSSAKPGQKRVHMIFNWGQHFDVFEESVL